MGLLALLGKSLDKMDAISLLDIVICSDGFSGKEWLEIFYLFFCQPH